MQMTRQIWVAAALLAAVSFIFSGQHGFFFVFRKLPSNKTVMGPSNETVNSPSMPGRFDFYKLSLQWPPSICSNSPITCSRVPKQFTIHGLWPQRHVDVLVDPYDVDPLCVDPGTIPVDPVVLGQNLRYYLPTDVQLDLHLHWPDLFSKDDAQFWCSEWRKHGRCTDYAERPVLYFDSALALHSGFKDRQLLDDLLIEPGKQYTPSYILQRAMNVYNVYPQIVCDYDQLREIRFCYERGTPPGPPGPPRDCPYQLSGCDMNTPYDFPDWT